jgi:hypothetical protein
LWNAETTEQWHLDGEERQKRLAKKRLKKMQLKHRKLLNSIARFNKLLLYLYSKHRQK